jgi:hypothetical protein
MATEKLRDYAAERFAAFQQAFPEPDRLEVATQLADRKVKTRPHENPTYCFLAAQWGDSEEELLSITRVAHSRRMTARSLCSQPVMAVRQGSWEDIHRRGDRTDRLVVVELGWLAPDPDEVFEAAFGGEVSATGPSRNGVEPGTIIDPPYLAFGLRLRTRDVPTRIELDVAGDAKAGPVTPERHSLVACLGVVALTAEKYEATKQIKWMDIIWGARQCRLTLGALARKTCDADREHMEELKESIPMPTSKKSTAPAPSPHRRTLPSQRASRRPGGRKKRE